MSHNDNRTAAVIRRNRGYYTLSEIADIVGVAYRTLWANIDTGAMPVKPTGIFGKRRQRRYYTTADIQVIRALLQEEVAQ